MFIRRYAYQPNKDLQVPPYRGTVGGAVKPHTELTEVLGAAAATELPPEPTAEVVMRRTVTRIIDHTRYRHPPKRKPT
jgi:hypothetical protein